MLAGSQDHRIEDMFRTWAAQNIANQLTSTFPPSVRHIGGLSLLFHVVSKTEVNVMTGERERSSRRQAYFDIDYLKAVSTDYIHQYTCFCFATITIVLVAKLYRDAGKMAGFCTCACPNPSDFWRQKAGQGISEGGESTHFFSRSRTCYAEDIYKPLNSRIRGGLASLLSR